MGDSKQGQRPGWQQALFGIIAAVGVGAVTAGAGGAGTESSNLPSGDTPIVQLIPSTSDHGLGPITDAIREGLDERDAEGEIEGEPKDPDSPTTEIVQPLVDAQTAPPEGHEGRQAHLDADPGGNELATEGVEGAEDPEGPKDTEDAESAESAEGAEDTEGSKSGADSTESSEPGSEGTEDAEGAHGTQDSALGPDGAESL